MKRYYVSHFSGMTKDSEFEEIRDQVVKEGLNDPDSGRDHRRVRWPDGRTTDQAFTHLWADRTEAEAFASRLRKGDDDRRWKVFEVDVEGTLAEILDPKNLQLPKYPRVATIRFEPYLVPYGDEILRIRVVLEDKVEPDRRYEVAVRPIREAIKAAMTSEKIGLDTMIDFRTEAELSSEPQRHRIS